MKKIFNLLFYVLKFLLLIGAMGLTLFILIRMSIRLEKNMLSILPIFIPFVLLLIIFMINMFLKQESVTGNLFYNLTCCLVFSVIVFVGIRSIIDTNMVLNGKYGYGINFNFFDNFIPYIKIMLYGLFIGNLFYMIRFKDKKTGKKKVKGK